MNYLQAREYLSRITAKGNKLGLEAITILMEELGNPQNDLKFIHIAGTNGKGSVMAYLEEILIRAGYRVGRYISPCLFSYEEKIRVNNEIISRDDIARLTGICREAQEKIAAHCLPEATIFEVETAISFLYFKEKKCDIVLLETGMGGREDATNLVTTTILEIFSSISLDHMEYLGDTLAKIAGVKAGIIKEGIPAVSDAQDPSAAEVIIEECRTKNTTVTFVDPSEIHDVCYVLNHQTFSYRGRNDICIPLNGIHQIRNAALALDAADALIALGYRISEQNILDGCANAVWSGRFEVVHKRPVVVMDGAHNPDAAKVLRQSIDTYFPDQKIYCIFGVFSDKEYDKIIDITADRAAKIYTVETKDNPRALPYTELADAVALRNKNVVPVGDMKCALQMAMKDASAEDVIIVFGSLSFLWEVREYFADQKSSADQQ